MEEKKIRCSGCDVLLEPGTVKFSYLGRDFSHSALKCPKCGYVFISEEVARGKMAEVEKTLEGK